MIIYATKQTVDRYGMTMPENIQNPINNEIKILNEKINQLFN